MKVGQQETVVNSFSQTLCGKFEQNIAKPFRENPCATTMKTLNVAYFAFQTFTQYKKIVEDPSSALEPLVVESLNWVVYRSAQNAWSKPEEKSEKDTANTVCSIKIAQVLVRNFFTKEGSLLLEAGVPLLNLITLR